MHPMQQNCNPNDKKQMAAWCWAAGVKDPRPAAFEPVPLIIPQLSEGISEMLWDFGFRHHPELQTKWIEGGAGVGTLARIVDHEPRDWVKEAGEEWLAENNPEMLKAIQNASPEEKEKLLAELQKNFEQLEKLIRLVKPVEE